MPPSPANRWSGVRDATTQRDGCLRAGWYGTSGSEDCLYVNVYAPAADCRPASSGLDGPRSPVMLWIYGGGYQLGGTRTNTDGSADVGSAVSLASIMITHDHMRASGK